MKCWKEVRSLIWTWKMFSGIWFGTWEFYHCWLFQTCIKIVHYKCEGTAKWFEHLLQTLKFHPGIIYAKILACLTCEMWYIWYLLPVFCGISCCLPRIWGSAYWRLFINPSALPSIRRIDLCFFTCYRPLYVIQLAGSDGAHLNAYLLQGRRSLKFRMTKLQQSIKRKSQTNDPIFLKF